MDRHYIHYTASSAYRISPEELYMTCFHTRVFLGALLQIMEHVNCTNFGVPNSKVCFRAQERLYQLECIFSIHFFTSAPAFLKGRGVLQNCNSDRKAYLHALEIWKIGGEFTNFEVSNEENVLWIYHEKVCIVSNRIQIRKKYLSIKLTLIECLGEGVLNFVVQNRTMFQRAPYWKAYIK